MEQYLFMFGIAVAAGMWRVVDGRGKLWLPLDTWMRNLGTFIIALAMGHMVFGYGWESVASAVVASLLIIDGYPKGGWESLPKMLWHYPGKAFGMPLVFTTVIIVGAGNYSMGVMEYLNVLWTVVFAMKFYLLAQAPQAVLHWYINHKGYDVPVSYLTEYFAGVVRIGAIPLLTIL